MNKLKTCPFCGGKADTGRHKSRNKDDEYYLVMCVHCFARTVGETFEEAEDTWNTRADGWIPISKKWPDKNGHYLVTYHEWTDGNYLPKYDEVYVRILRFNKAIFRLPVCVDKEAEKDTHREVLAWQSLPEPWKEGAGE